MRRSVLSMFLHVSWCLQSVVSSETVSETFVSSLIWKRNALVEQLEYFFQTPIKINGDGGSGNQLAYRVCAIVSDIWCLFKKTKFDFTKLDILGYCPDESIVEKYWKMCEQLLNISADADDENGNREYIEETDRDVVMFALAKLVVTDSVPKEHLAPEIISHLETYGSSVTEIVKHLLTALKKKGDILSLLVEALKKECKDLASQLSGSYVGAARNKYKSEIMSIVKDGFNYAFFHAPRQLSFLDGVLLRFISKLPAPDILDVMRGVERRTENVNTDEDPSGWRPYFTFLDNLCEKYARNEAVEDAKEGKTVRRRGRPRKNQNRPGKRLFDEQSSSGEEDSISGSDQDAGVEDEEEVPLIHSLRASSKLRSLRVSKDDEGAEKNS